MSVADLKAFLAKVEDDEGLRQKLHAASGMDDIVDLAAAHGHSVDKASVLRAHGEALSSASDHQLKAINSWGDALMHCFGAHEEV
ncbi:Nif11-like leader peptide family natural product precursor [Synechococcus sp. LA31]|uniref:Nif11-like leader peptide family natural product precursor n=1 Tax=Synechococcaceae TaxID=1890426 RepID=UPI001BDC1D96|nr:Nif11-like leader peptide family natural product precursor [Synechococcus sp. LA31]QVV66553.1 Nif11-like leader peptide family RiPP precursor [Synechococcus sp. LA31]